MNNVLKRRSFVRIWDVADEEFGRQIKTFADVEAAMIVVNLTSRAVGFKWMVHILNTERHGAQQYYNIYAFHKRTPDLLLPVAAIGGLKMAR